MLFKKNWSGSGRVLLAMDELNKKMEHFGTDSPPVQIGTTCLLGENQISKMFRRLWLLHTNILKYLHEL
jgi:hypothetical protein